MRSSWIEKLLNHIESAWIEHGNLGARPVEIIRAARDSFVSENHVYRPLGYDQSTRLGRLFALASIAQVDNGIPIQPLIGFLAQYNPTAWDLSIQSYLNRPRCDQELAQLLRGARQFFTLEPVSIKPPEERWPEGLQIVSQAIQTAINFPNDAAAKGLPIDQLYIFDEAIRGWLTLANAGCTGMTPWGEIPSHSNPQHLNLTYDLSDQAHLSATQSKQGILAFPDEYGPYFPWFVLVLFAVNKNGFSSKQNPHLSTDLELAAKMLLEEWLPQLTAAEFQWIINSYEDRADPNAKIKILKNLSQLWANYRDQIDRIVIHADRGPSLAQIVTDYVSADLPRTTMARIQPTRLQAPAVPIVGHVPPPTSKSTPSERAAWAQISTGDLNLAHPKSSTPNLIRNPSTPGKIR